MRALLGFMQIGLGIGGLVALFNGQWVTVISAWAGAFLIGFIGNRMTRSLNGVSDSAYESMQNIPQAVKQIRDGNYRSAEGLSSGAVNAFRMGGDKALLPMALLVRAVALGAGEKYEPARKAIEEAERLSRTTPAQYEEFYDEIRPMILHVQRELNSAQPSSRRLVSDFLAMNDAV